MLRNLLGAVRGLFHSETRDDIQKHVKHLKVAMAENRRAEQALADEIAAITERIEMNGKGMSRD